MKSRTIRRVAGVLLAMGVASRGAADAKFGDLVSGAAGAAPSSAPIAASASIASIDRVMDFAADYNLPLENVLSASTIENVFSIGKGGLSTDRPMGLYYAASPNIDPGQKSVIFAFPVKPDAAPISTFMQNGGRLTGPQKDTVALDGTTVRRTAGYLYLGATPQALEVLSDRTLADFYAQPSTLAAMHLDLAGFRTAVPDEVQAFLDSAFKGNENPDGQWAVDLVKGWFERDLNTVDVLLDHDQKEARIRLSVDPVQLPGADARAVPLPRPGLPDGIIARADLFYASPEAAQWPVKTFNGLIDQYASQDKDLTPQRQQQVKSLLAKISGLLLSADAQSIGVGQPGGAYVVYVVNQYRQRTNFLSSLQKLVADANRLCAESDKTDKTTFALSIYTAGDGQIATRVTVTDSGKTVGCMDAVQSGNVVTMTFAADDVHHIDDALDLKRVEQLTALTSGGVDLGNLGKVLVNTPGNPLFALIPQKQQDVLNLLRGQVISWTATGQGLALAIDLRVPLALLRSGTQLVALFQPPDNANP